MLRDDIKSLLDEILELIKKKNVLLKNLSQREMDFFYLIPDPLFNDYENHFEEAEEISEEIDEHDYYVETATDHISKICGIDRDNTLKILIKQHSPSYDNLKNIIEENVTLENKIQKQGQKNQDLLTEEIEKLKASKKSAEKIEEIKLKYGIEE